MNITRTMLYHEYKHSNKISAQTSSAQLRKGIRHFASQWICILFERNEICHNWTTTASFVFPRSPFLEEIPSPVFIPEYHTDAAALYLQFLESKDELGVGWQRSPKGKIPRLHDPSNVLSSVVQWPCEHTTLLLCFEEFRYNNYERTNVGTCDAEGDL